MITSWFTLNKCAEYVDKHYRGAVLEHCVTYRKNELLLQFRDRKGLVLHLGMPFQYILPASRAPSGKLDKMRIFPGIDGSIVEEVDMLPGERVLRFRMKNGDTLNAVFRSNRGNAVYLSGKGPEYFKKKLRIDPEELREREPVQYASLAEDVRFNPYWKKHIAEVLGTEDYRRILRIIQDSNGCVIGKRFVLCDDPQPYDPERFFEHYRSYVVNRLQEARFHREYRSLERRISRELNDLQKKLQKSQNDTKLRERAGKYRYFADTLSACRYDIPEHTEKFAIPPEFQAPEYPAAVPLRTDISLSENINRYYEKARDSETHMREDRERSRLLRERYREWDRLYGRFRKVKDYRDLLEWKKQYGDRLPPADRRSRGIDERRPYTEHVTAEDWRIWVGRSARDNDEMTFKYAAKNDIWLHARNSTGSHVIIKREGKKTVPQKVLHYAAALAARNSEEKHSSLVAVAYTERKYVTKRKGFPPGKVHFQFEKDLMVKPLEKV